MSRTVSEGLKFTRLDTDIFFDRKIKRLCRLCDENAPMVYIGLLCLIGKDGYYIEWNKDTMLDVAEMLRKDEEYIDKAVNACIEAELFSKEMYDQYGILTSHGIQEQYNFVKATAKSKIRVSMYSLLQNEESSDKKAITSERKPKTSEVITQIKEKENIEEKSKQTKNIHSSYCLPKEKEQQEEIIVSYFFFEKNFQHPWGQLEQLKAYNDCPGMKGWDNLSLTEKEGAMKRWRQEPEEKPRFDSDWLSVWKTFYNICCEAGASKEVRLAILDDKLTVDYSGKMLVLGIKPALRSFIEHGQTSEGVSIMELVKPVLWPFIIKQGCQGLHYKPH